MELSGSVRNNVIDASALTLAGVFIDGFEDNDTIIGTNQRDVLRGSFGEDLLEGF